MRIILREGRDIPVRRGHPWIFSGAIQTIDADGDETLIAEVFDSKQRWLARGLFSPKSQIRVRLLTWQQEAIDGRFFTRRLSQAFALRRRHLSTVTNSYRVVNGEGDFLPGLVIDRYGDFGVCQFFTAGMQSLKGAVLDAVSETLAFRGLYERSEGRVREDEGLDPSVGVLSGEAPPELLAIEEHGFKFRVDARHGQKTGFFLDQRENRLQLSALTRDRTVLNCFSYTGAFSVYALGGGARRVTSLDSSRPALEIAEQHFQLNGFADFGELLKGDAFSYLKETDERYDLIVLDPPSLAHKRSDVSAATGGYKFLNLHALRHLNPGGLLFTFSCSQHISADLFQKVVFGAALDAGRKVSYLKRLGQPMDHPVSLHHPEGEYLKGLVLRVLD